MSHALYRFAGIKRLTFRANLLNMDDPMNAFSTTEASLNYGKILGALAIKAVIEVHPATSPVSTNISGALLTT